MTWKTYQESLPASGAYGVGTADGYFSDATVFTNAETALGETNGAVEALYRAKHDPFVYFLGTEQTAVNGQIPGVVSYEGANGLWADLATGHVPNFSFVVPNQCHDQHATGSYPFCAGDPLDNGMQAGLNPGLMAVGDMEIQSLVAAIKASPVWKKGRTAIVITWDESDYAVAPITNQVFTIVDKNYGTQGVWSNKFYTHFSLLKTIEAGFRLPCLNHACDTTTRTMYDLFQ